MTIKKKSEMTDSLIQFDLTGPDGNACVLLGLAKKLSKQLKKNAEDIQKRMISGDYENLVAVSEEEFGDFVDLYR